MLDSCLESSEELQSLLLKIGCGYDWSVQSRCQQAAPMLLRVHQHLPRTTVSNCGTVSGVRLHMAQE